MSDQHHKWEQGIILLMNLDGWDLEWTGEAFEHYDAKGKTPKGFDCVIEFKLRNKYYQTKILEHYKYSKLMQEPNVMKFYYCLLYTSPSPRDRQKSRMPSSA